MELWLDSTNINAIKELQQLGVLYGITTNPSLAAKSGKALAELLSSLLEVQTGPVAVQVVSSRFDEMIKQAETLHSFSNRLIIKIPVTREGLRAISALSKKKIPIMATAIFDGSQALLAASVGAQYLAPYYSKICDSDLNGFERFSRMVASLRSYRYPSKVIAASLRTSEQTRACADLGLDAMTMNEEVFNDYVADHPRTLETLSKFHSDWKNAPACKILNFQT